MTRLTEIEERCRGATKGPWTADGSGMMVVAKNYAMKVCDIRGWGHLIGVGGMNLSDEEATKIQKANELFIAHSREDVPYLLSLVRTLERKLGVAVDCLKFIHQRGYTGAEFVAREALDAIKKLEEEGRGWCEKCKKRGSLQDAAGSYTYRCELCTAEERRLDILLTVNQPGITWKVRRATLKYKFGFADELIDEMVGKTEPASDY